MYLIGTPDDREPLSDANDLTGAFHFRRTATYAATAWRRSDLPASSAFWIRTRPRGSYSREKTYPREYEPRGRVLIQDADDAGKSDLLQAVAAYVAVLRE